MQIKRSALTVIKGLMLMLTTLAFVACDSQVSEQQMVQSASEYLDQNKIREAAIELKNVLQQNPENAEARYMLGLINLDVGDTASAEKEFRRAAGAGWSGEQAQIGLARAMINRKEFQKLLDEIEIKDNYSANARADLYALQALAQAGLRDIERARETLDKGSELDAKAFHVLKSAIQIQLAAGNMEHAGESLKLALAAYEDNQEILLLSAIAALRNKDKEKAATAYRKVVEMDPVNLVSIYGRQARLVLARMEIVDGMFDQAQAMLMPLIKQNANDPETNFVRGLLAFEQGELDLAEERLFMVLKVAPDHALTQLLFGTVSYAQQDYEQAAYYIAKYVSVMPDNLGARKLLGRTYIKLGQHDEAQATLQPGLESSADDAELLALVGLSQLQGGDVVSGIEGLEKAVQAAPESLKLRSRLASAYISVGETENAIKELNIILAEGGDNKQAEALLISAYIKAEHYDKAIDVALDMVQQNPEDPAVLSVAGNVFVASNDRPEARKYFNRALQVKPGYVQATMLLARLEELDGYHAKAEVLYKKLADTNTEDIAPLMALARLAETQNQAVEMLVWLEQARKRAPRDIRPLKILAEYYLREQALEKVSSLINEAIKIAPRDNTLLTLRARLQMAEGQYNKALLSLNELVTRVPDSVFIRAMLGETYFRLDQLTDARRQLEIVLEKQPYYVPALVLMANLELRSGNNEQALQYAGKIQKTQPDLYMGYEIAGDASMLKKNHADAKVSYEQAWGRKQLSGLAIKLSEASTRSGEFEEATKPLLTWLSDNPSDARALQFLGTAYQNMKRDDKAIEAFGKVLAIQPDNVVSLNNLAWLYSLANNPKALELAERAYRVSSNDSGVQDTYGWILVQQGQVEKGRRILAQVVEALPEVPEVQYHYAVALLKSGDEEEALKLLGRLLKGSKSFEGREEAERLVK